MKGKRKKQIFNFLQQQVSFNASIEYIKSKMQYLPLFLKLSFCPIYIIYVYYICVYVRGPPSLNMGPLKTSPAQEP